ncbi:MAG: hypothetical protein KAX51_04415 [Chromatiaceae bacterium]|nr:hypothetical protein [Chromatiaceae bacterium]
MASRRSKFAAQSDLTQAPNDPGGGWQTPGQKVLGRIAALVLFIAIGDKKVLANPHAIHHRAIEGDITLIGGENARLA